MTVYAKKELLKIYGIKIDDEQCTFDEDNFKSEVVFDDEQYTPNGIDLRLKAVYLPENISRGVFGINKGEKFVPQLIEIPPLDGTYILNPKKNILLIAVIWIFLKIVCNFIIFEVPL